MTELSTRTTPDPVEIHVPGSKREEAAIKLLAAARETGHPIESVETIGDGFVAPSEVARAAGYLSGEAPAGAAIAATLAQSDQHPMAAGAASASSADANGEQAVERSTERVGEHTGPDDSSVRGAVETSDSTEPGDGAVDPGDGAAEPGDGTQEPAQPVQEPGDGGSTMTGTPDSSAGDSGELRGAALLEALKVRGLPQTGTADQQRARVAEYDAQRSPAPAVQ